MAKLNVDTIKEEAERTRANYRGRLGEEQPRYPITVANVRIYVRKVLFLCKEIERLKKKK